MNRKFCLGDTLTTILIASLLVLALCAGIAKLLAADTPVETTDQVRVYSFAGWEPGTYHVTITIGNDGEIVSIGSLKIVEVPVPKLTPTKPTTPEDPEGPDDPTDPLAVTVLGIVAQAPQDAKVREALAKLFEVTGQLPVTKTDQLRKATKILFVALGLSSEWETWKEKLDDAVGSVDDVGELKRLWELIASKLK